MDEKVEEIIRWAGDREASANFTVLPEGMALFTGESFLSINDKNASTIARLVRIQKKRKIMIRLKSKN
ncbi:hypothetical protein ACM1RC_21400 [Paenibacillus azoreducens]|uniref:hypothetical protein n=1 Tax=Paenibacillus azoreducens TaxID=116718 RepID=UPI0039F52A14